MAEVASAYVSLIPSAKGFGKGISRQIGGDTARAGRQAGDRFGKVFASSSIKPIRAIGAAAIGLFAVDKVVGFFKSANAEARESQKVSALTAQVIKTTGGAANVTADQIGRLSTAISNKSGIDDEAIQSGANLLLTFKGIRNEAGKGNDVFNQATQAITDMGAALGKEPKAAAIQLGKALNDPIKGVTALTRVGVSFTAQQKQQIKAMVASGNTLGAQKIILKELSSEFGGAAAASATNGEKLRVAFDNFKEQIGTALLPIIDRVAGVLTSTVIPALSDFFTELKSGVGFGRKFRAVAAQLGTAMVALGKGVQQVVNFFRKHTTTAKVLVGVLTAVTAVTYAHAAALAIQTGRLKAWFVQTKLVTAATKVYAAVQWVLNAALSANPIGLVVIAVAALVAGLVIAYKRSETFRQIVVGSFKLIAAAGSAMWNNVLKPTFRFIVSAFLNVASAIVNGAARAFGWVPGLGGKLKAAAAKFNEFRDSVNRALDGTHSKKSVTVVTPGMRKALNDLATLRYRAEHIPKSVTIGVTNKATAQNLAGRRAAGGPVRAGSAYLVGEHRPEVFVPDRNGTILPSVPSGRQTTFQVYGPSAADVAREVEIRERRLEALHPSFG